MGPVRALSGPSGPVRAIWEQTRNDEAGSARSVMDFSDRGCAAERRGNLGEALENRIDDSRRRIVGSA